jgi:hypothetical protein
MIAEPAAVETFAANVADDAERQAAVAAAANRSEVCLIAQVLSFASVGNVTPCWRQLS